MHLGTLRGGTVPGVNRDVRSAVTLTLRTSHKTLSVEVRSLADVSPSQGQLAEIRALNRSRAG